MLFLLALAVTATPLPLTSDEEADIRCLGTVGALSRGQASSRLAVKGREFAVLVGADIMDRTGRTREQVANLMLAEGKRAAARKPFESEVVYCVGRIDERVNAEAATDPLLAPLPKPQR